MDLAKAVINVKEGIIQLEGPVEFVKCYLDVYRSTISGIPGATGGAATAPAKEVPARSKRPARKPRGRRRATCVNVIRKEIKNGWFAELRSVKEIQQRVTDTGMTCTDGAVRMNLKRLSDRGLLSPVKEGRSIRYQRS